MTEANQAARRRNEAEARAKDGPARMNQESAPIADALKDLRGRHTLSIDVPAVAPGEVLNDATTGYFEALSAAGGFVGGAADQTLRTLRVAR